MWNQYNTQAMYNVEDWIEILFDQMKMEQEFAIAGNLPFSDTHLADMGLQKSKWHMNIHMSIACGRVLQLMIS